MAIFGETTRNPKPFFAALISIEMAHDGPWLTATTTTHGTTLSPNLVVDIRKPHDGEHMK